MVFENNFYALFLNFQLQGMRTPLGIFNISNYLLLSLLLYSATSLWLLVWNLTISSVHFLPSSLIYVHTNSSSDFPLTHWGHTHVCTHLYRSKTVHQTANPRNLVSDSSFSFQDEITVQFYMKLESITFYPWLMGGKHEAYRVLVCILLTIFWIRGAILALSVCKSDGLLKQYAAWQHTTVHIQQHSAQKCWYKLKQYIILHNSSHIVLKENTHRAFFCISCGTSGNNTKFMWTVDYFYI